MLKRGIMGNQINQVIIERNLYTDEVGITHGFFSAKIIFSDRTLFMAPFDSMEEAMFAVKRKLLSIRVLVDPFPNLWENAQEHRIHPPCRCILISDTNAEEAS